MDELVAWILFCSSNIMFYLFIICVRDSSKLLFRVGKLFLRLSQKKMNFIIGQVQYLRCSWEGERSYAQPLIHLGHFVKNDNEKY